MTNELPNYIITNGLIFYRNNCMYSVGMYVWLRLRMAIEGGKIEVALTTIDFLFVNMYDKYTSCKAYYLILLKCYTFTLI